MNPYAFGGAKPYEHEWQHLKAQELAGQMFEDEYDLALAVMDGVKARAQKGKYAIERFIFNSTLAAY